MTNKEQIVLEGGNKCTLRIDALSSRLSSDPDDETWVECLVSIECPDFAGRTRANLTLSELRHMAESARCLVRLDKSSANLRPFEPVLEYDITANGRGSFDSNIVVTKRDSSDLRVEFAVSEISVSSMERFISAINSVVRNVH
jgi:hypothetical protein